MRRRLLFFLSLLMTTQLWAQHIVTGRATESQGKKPVELATAALLKTNDTKVLRAASTAANGTFTLVAPAPGKYTVRLSYLGYETVTKNIEIKAGTDTLKVGDLLMQADNHTLGTATVSVTASKVEQKDDTTMFNAKAYRVPEGSTLEALVKQLPGVEVGDDGSIKWNGKTVKEFLINGKDFSKAIRKRP